MKPNIFIQFYRIIISKWEGCTKMQWKEGKAFRLNASKHPNLIGFV